MLRLICLFSLLIYSNLLESKPFSLSAFEKTGTYLKIDDKKREMLFDKDSQVFGLSHEGQFYWAKLNENILLKQGQDIYQIRVIAKDKLLVKKFYYIDKLKFDFQLIHSSSNAFLELQSESLLDSDQPMRGASIFGHKGLHHIPTVPVFYSPFDSNYHQSTTKDYAENYLKNFFESINDNLIQNFISLSNFCSLYSEEREKCNDENLEALVALHFSKGVTSFQSYFSCLESEVRPIECLVNALIWEEKLALEKKIKFTSNIEKSSCDDRKTFEACYSYARLKLFESIGHSDCLGQDFDGCLIEKKAKLVVDTYLPDIKKYFSKSPKFLELFKQTIHTQVAELSEVRPEMVFEAYMNKVVPEIHWQQTTRDIFKRDISFGESLLKAKLVILKQGKLAGRAPASSCQFRKGALMADIQDLIRICTIYAF